jgi:hypothetical protein
MWRNPRRRDVGSFRRPRLSDSEVCRLYRAGTARDAVGMMAGLIDREVCEVLRRNGVPLRNDAESAALAVANRARWKSTLRMTKRLRRT